MPASDSLLPTGADPLSALALTGTGPAASVLVVDDSRFVRLSLVRGLAGRFPLLQADSGERAWELLLLDPTIGAVLSDLSMPGMDGFSLLGRVRGSMLERVRRMPFAVLSGADDPAHRERARALGADRFVVKGEAVDVLAEWLDTRLAAMPPASATPPATATPQSAPLAPGTLAATTRLVPDPLPRWLHATAERIAATGEGPAALLRLHAPGMAELPARLRRGVRAADALHVETSDTAWLCMPATPALAVRLAVRFGLLAAGRASTPHARVSVCVGAIDVAGPSACVDALRVRAPTLPDAPGLALGTGEDDEAGGWRCLLPWPAARLLIG